MNTIGFKVLNFNKFVKNLDVKLFLDDNSTLPCDSISSQFMNKDHNYIITVNLNIIKLR